MKTTLALDHNRLFPLDVTYDEPRHELHIAIGRDANPSARFTENIYNLLSCNGTKGEHGSDSIIFKDIAPDFSLALGSRPFAHIDAAGAVSDHHPLIASLTRLIGTYHGSKVASLLASPERTDIPKGLVTADFHTHSSGQISARGQLEVALAHDAYYPVHLLNDIDIDVSAIPKTDKRIEPRIPFQPLEPQALPDTVECVRLAALPAKDLRTLEQHMSLRTDRQSTFTNVEYECYRLRYPFSKNTDLLKDTLKKMAEESLASGITYAEVSFVGLDKPEIFRKVHEAIFEMEHDPKLKDFTLRLKHGIPRSFTVGQVRESLEKATHVLQSPYVLSIDLLGYEVNKTKKFIDLLDEFCGWMKQNLPDPMLCVHAGENDKNPDNVMEALTLADKHGITARIGHGLYGLNKRSIALAQKLVTEHATPHIYVESNIDSNVALHNVTDLKRMHFDTLFKNDIPTVACSDSYGLYQTDPAQLAASLAEAGVSDTDLDRLRTYQTELEARGRAASAVKLARLGGLTDQASLDAFIDRTTAAIAAVPKAKVPTPLTPEQEAARERAITDMLAAQGVSLIPNAPASANRKLIESLPDELKGKNALTVIGASGASWDRVSKGHRHQFAVACDMLTQALDPEKIYFVQGRNKLAGGVSNVLNDAIRNANANANAKSDTPFFNLGILADAIPDPEVDYSHLSHMLRIKSRLDIADKLADFTVNHNGTMVAFGGASFTRDAILKADYRSLHRKRGFLLTMQGPEGASTDKALTMDDSYVFKGARELITRLHNTHPEYFRAQYKTLDASKLDQLYNGAIERIGPRYGTPESTTVDLKDIVPLSPPLGVAK